LRLCREGGVFVVYKELITATRAPTKSEEIEKLF